MASASSRRIHDVIDEGSREALTIEVDVSLPSERVVTVLDQQVEIHCAPRWIRGGNGANACQKRGGRAAIGAASPWCQCSRASQIRTSTPNTSIIPIEQEVCTCASHDCRRGVRFE